MVMEAIQLDARLEGADLVLTGEGSIDSQTARFGKGPAAVARQARALKVPVLGIGGRVADEAEVRRLFDDLEASAPPGMPLKEAISQARPLLVAATIRLLRRHLSESG